MALSVMACGSVEESPESAIQSDPLGEQESELRACSTDLDCRTNCRCGTGGFCVGASSPVPPAGYCDVAPVRACNTGADCMAGCLCSSNVCTNDGGFSPPANCLLAPPDPYENDNSHTTASSYLGYPQVGHTFHRAGDVDWVLGATNISQLLTVEAYNNHGGQLRLDVYAYNHPTRTLGALLTSATTTVCSDITPACLMYRASVNVAPGVYAVKVTDLRSVPAGSDWRPTAGYDLKMY